MNQETLGKNLSQAQIVERTNLHATSLGFEGWSYSACVQEGIQTPFEWSLHNFSPELWAAYAGDRRSTENPIAKRSRQRMIPMVWTADQMFDGSGCTDCIQPKLHEAAKRHGVQGGLCLPIHDVSGMIATLTLLTFRPATKESLDNACMSALLFSKYLHEACRSYVMQASGTPLKIALSPRELECLSWASKGKTSWEIGRLLGISEHTAIFHLRNAASKLGTSTRQQAVAKSIRLRLVAA